MAEQQQTPGALLGLFMRRRGWSAPRLAEIATGVSASSIRAYVADRTAPRPAHALAIATALGPLNGKALLEAWGHPDLAEGYMARWQDVAGQDPIERLSEAVNRYNRTEYAGEPLSEAGLEVVRAVTAWLQVIEKAASASRPAARRGSLPPDAE